jgi:hypothetical protein
MFAAFNINSIPINTAMALRLPSAANNPQLNTNAARVKYQVRGTIFAASRAYKILQRYDLLLNASEQT